MIRCFLAIELQLRLAFEKEACMVPVRIYGSGTSWDGHGDGQIKNG